jgi:SAM-dependent methyltransferase
MSRECPETAVVMPDSSLITHHSSLTPAFAAWDEWQPAEYLREYYRDVEPDERYLLEFLVEAMREIPPVPIALDFGCGPTVHRLFPLVPRVREFHLAEYLPLNRAAVAGWVAARPEAHDWSPFARETLRIEGDLAPPEARVYDRQQATRERISEIVPADAGEIDPLGRERRASYPLVTTHYCADSATDDLETWRRYMQNIAGLVRPGGHFVVSALGGSRGYRVGSHWFPGASITAQDVSDFLDAAGFTGIDLRERAVPDRTEQGYGSVIFARATKAD